MTRPDDVVGARPGRDIGALVSAMSVDEKAALTAGVDTWRTAAVERLGSLRSK